MSEEKRRMVGAVLDEVLASDAARDLLTDIFGRAFAGAAGPPVSRGKRNPRRRVGQAWCDVLGCEPDADYSEARAAYRESLRDAHPDHGGDLEEFEAVRRAWSEYRRDARRRGE